MIEADWEVEIGGGAPAIDAQWAGWIDLRRWPERIAEIAEAAGFAPLAQLLLTLNAPHSPLWTAKCDLWEQKMEEETAVPGEQIVPPGAGEGTKPCSLACYIDLLPVEGLVFAEWTSAEEICRAWTTRLDGEMSADGRVDWVVRMALAGAAEGFGVTAYLSVVDRDRAAAEAALARLMERFAAALLPISRSESEHF
jgi:hypothetical protein